MAQEYRKKRILRDADNVPIPQYWDEDTVDFKPMPKPTGGGDVSISDVGISDNGNKLKVNEDGSIDVKGDLQLTGSNVEESSDTFYTVPANNRIDISPTENIGKYNSFSVLCRDATGSRLVDLDIEIELLASGKRNGLSAHRGRIVLTSDDYDIYEPIIRVSKVFPVTVPGLAFRLINRSDEDIELDFSIYWRV